jgi:hypothetical protein
MHARIKMNCSILKAHLYDMHILNDSSSRCGSVREDAFHFLFECPNYTALRSIMHGQIISIAPFNNKTLLYGDSNVDLDKNIDIFHAVMLLLKRVNVLKLNY